MILNEFDYPLPKELIAQEPAKRREESRLMVLHKNNAIEHLIFKDIIKFLNPGDVLVLNETKVSRAKLVGKKATGGKVELIVEKKLSDFLCKCRIRATKPKIGNLLVFNSVEAKIVDKKDDIFFVLFDRDVNNILEKKAMLPTPPYIKKPIKDFSRYQTVFAKKEGSLAAPTASLHFSRDLLEKIARKGVSIAKICLHISFGTFLKVRAEQIVERKLHSEYFEISKEAAEIINKRKGRLFAVGTTVVRALESAADKQGKIKAMKKRTELFIMPGYKFKSSIDALITNFHLPKSSLLMLVCAFAGKERIMRTYREAIEKKYRFFSFGDAMLVFR